MRLSFLNLRTRSAIKTNGAHRETIPYGLAHKIGIVFTVEDQTKHQLVKELIAKLKGDGKEIQVLEFLPKHKDNPEFMFDFFSDEDLGFWGTINNPSVDKFRDVKFDYLLNLDTNTNPLIQNVLAGSRAQCRVGKFEKSLSPLFELMIESNGSVRGLIESMYQYLKKLQ